MIENINKDVFSLKSQFSVAAIHEISLRILAEIGIPIPSKRTPSRPIPEPPSGGPVAAGPKSNSLSIEIPLGDGRTLVLEDS